MDEIWKSNEKEHFFFMFLEGWFYLHHDCLILQQLQKLFFANFRIFLQTPFFEVFKINIHFNYLINEQIQINRFNLVNFIEINRSLVFFDLYQFSDYFLTKNKKFFQVIGKFDIFVCCMNAEARNLDFIQIFFLGSSEKQQQIRRKNKIGNIIKSEILMFMCLLEGMQNYSVDGKGVLHEMQFIVEN
eukprot:TRINITY_DN9773_c2_g1_i1.p1 TRINITY_DN9773_c2_g1~~TRINITY_DN9773_c2_g1_i1.p1  ORF type:complete len:187 (+),score=7.51 TRINITY_DN9773_c2_g1_i1:158-718(+)